MREWIKYAVTGKIIIVTILLLYSNNAYAVSSRKDYFSKPQVGFWFGPVAPFYKKLDTALGGGAYFRYTTPYQPLKLGLDTSYQHFKSKGVNELTVVPLYGNLVYLLPIKLPIRFQFKAGLGAGYVYMKPDNYGLWDPLFMTGLEVSFPAGRVINIGLRIDYLYLYEGYAKSSKKGGHIMNIGLMLYFNI